MFLKKYVSDNKCIDMSVLPLCRSVLQLHADRCNDIPPIGSCGWYHDGSIQWIEKNLPEIIMDILLDRDYDTDDEYGSNVETDEDV